MIFVTKAGDKKALEALDILKDYYEVLVLQEGDQAPQGAVALFTVDKQKDLRGRGGRYLRLGKLTGPVVPDWAATCQMHIGVHRTEDLCPVVKPSYRGGHIKNPSRFSDAIMQVARQCFTVSSLV